MTVRPAIPAIPAIAVAPMMDWTDRHCRYFLRLLSPHALLYTEMVTAQAIGYGNRDQLLAFDPAERPLALQVGGSDPDMLAGAAKIGAHYGYDEINLNVGCPSDRVQSGRFGACLMARPALVRDCVAAMRGAVDVPVTVKSRIGIDDHEDYGFLRDFVGTVAESGCDVFIVHARNAILSGLSPKANREVPPLRYEYVYRLKQEFPQLFIMLNGGVRDLAAVHAHLARVDGVMIGREAYHNPYFLAELAQALHGAELPARGDIMAAFLEYIERRLAEGVRLSAMTRHVLGLYLGRPGARGWRRHLAEGACAPGAGADVVRAALRLVA
ncbi:MAG TPA: tRNA dihydrouridine(20/20a) synthase DusA [Gammaproteobacteria bacterium]|nr:tRNA dihydrouridine(20/20a) synthase DusA [Gammaproteobacteria bacterium]